MAYLTTKNTGSAADYLFLPKANSGVITNLCHFFCYCQAFCFCTIHSHILLVFDCRGKILCMPDITRGPQITPTDNITNIVNPHQLSWCSAGHFDPHHAHYWSCRVARTLMTGSMLRHIGHKLPSPLGQVTTSKAATGKDPWIRNEGRVCAFMCVWERKAVICLVNTALKLTHTITNTQYAYNHCRQ